MRKQHPSYKKALLLEYLTIGWNVFEGLSSVLVGVLTGSVSLFAYGLESSVEVFASSLVVWELKGTNEAPRAKSPRFLSENASFQVSFIRGLRDHGFRLAENKKREETALKLIGFAYLIVSAYIFIDASTSLLEGHHPDRSFLGIILMIITVIAMGSLGLAKKTVGKKLGSSTVLADARFTLVDAALSGTVLIGLLFNTLFGWWWMDQAMALFLAGVAFREGVKEIF